MGRGDAIGTGCGMGLELGKKESSRASRALIVIRMDLQLVLSSGLCYPVITFFWRR